MIRSLFPNPVQLNVDAPKGCREAGHAQTTSYCAHTLYNYSFLRRCKNGEERSLAEVVKKLGNHKLKGKQEEVILAFVNSMDVFVSLPTRSG